MQSARHPFSCIYLPSGDSQTYLTVPGVGTDGSTIRVAITIADGGKKRIVAAVAIGVQSDFWIAPVSCPDQGVTADCIIAYHYIRHPNREQSGN